MIINESAAYIEGGQMYCQNGEFVGFRDQDGMYILISPNVILSLYEIAKEMQEVEEDEC
jgi:hypothetical protein